MKISDEKIKKIKIIKNGPYLVTGGITIKEMIIKPVGKHYEYEEGEELPQSESYAICRCGNTKTPPFCDGSHRDFEFDGEETATNNKYEERAEIFEGKTIDLMDDHRCALARFCHTERGSTWQLIKKSQDKEERKTAIKSANECPSGRLTIINKNGEKIEKEYEPSIEILQDPEKNVSSAVYVKGGIKLESADSSIYEVQNRYTLCRCGKSRNKPFCDGTHIRSAYKDDEK